MEEIEGTRLYLNYLERWTDGNKQRVHMYVKEFMHSHANIYIDDYIGEQICGFDDDKTIPIIKNLINNIMFKNLEVLYIKSEYEIIRNLCKYKMDGKL